MNRARMRKIAKALADDNRLRVLEAISRRGDHMSCGDVVSMLGVSPATVSHHLKILSDAGLIVCRRDGQCVYNEAVPRALEDYTRALLKLAGSKKAERVLGMLLDEDS